MALSRVLGALAMANAVLALALADSSPDRSADVWLLRNWIVQWLRGTDVFGLPGGQVDYPPWALVTFAPFALVPASALITVCSLAALVVMYRVAFVSARVMAPAAPPEAFLVPALLVLCWGASIRTVVLMTPVSFLLGLLAIRRRESPWQAGLCLGLSLAKPHIALPFLLWACVPARARIAVVAVAVVAIELAVFCLWTNSQPAAVVWQWIVNVRSLHFGNTELIGVTSLRAVIEGWTGSWLAADAWMLAFATAGLLALFLLRHRVLPGGAPLVVPFGSIWVLLSFYHYQDDLVLLAPAFMALYLTDVTLPAAVRVGALAVLQAILMADPRRRSWLMPLDAALIPGILDHSYRLAIFTALAGTTAVAWRGRVAAADRAMIAAAEGRRVSLSRREPDTTDADRHDGAHRPERPRLAARAGRRFGGGARAIGVQPWPDPR